MLEGSTLGERLYDLRKNHGFKSTESLSNAVGIPKSTLNHYENDEKNQSISYINLVKLAKFYGVTTDYLLGATTSDQQTRSDVAELNLTDEAICVLKSGEINNKLLCELMIQEKFPVFLRNIEIFVDNLASKRVVAFNYDVTLLHEQMSKQPTSPDEKKHLDTLKSSQIQADRYFKTVLYEDLDGILEEIRTKHVKNKKDPYNYLQNADISVNIREITKRIGNLDLPKKRAMVKQLDEQIAVLMEDSGVDISQENVEEVALLRILSLVGRTSEEMSEADKGEALLY